MSDDPRAGFYKARLIRGGPFVPVRIFWGLPVIDGEEQDRGPRWCVEVDGRTDRLEKDENHPDYRCRVPLDVHKFWPWCAKDLITEADYLFMRAHGAWAKQHAPHHPEAKPREAINRRGPSVF